DGGRTPTLLCAVARTDTVIVVFDMDERSYLRLQSLAREGKADAPDPRRVPVVLGLPGEKGFPHKGIVDAVDNRVDPKTGVIRFRAAFDNAAGKLTDEALAAATKKPAARVRVTVGRPRKALLVPPHAVAADPADGRYVLVVNDQNVVVQRP